MDTMEKQVNFYGKALIGMLEEEIAHEVQHHTQLMAETGEEQAMMGLNPHERFTGNEWVVIGGLMETAAVAARVDTLRGIRARLLQEYYRFIRQEG